MEGSRKNDEKGCVCERVCVWVCFSVRECERERVCVKARACTCVWLSKWMCLWGRVCVGVHAWVDERECEMKGSF